LGVVEVVLTTLTIILKVMEMEDLVVVPEVVNATFPGIG
jgi:hypothetical protein